MKTYKQLLEDIANVSGSSLSQGSEGDGSGNSVAGVSLPIKRRKVMRRRRPL